MTIYISISRGTLPRGSLAYVYWICGNWDSIGTPATLIRDLPIRATEISSPTPVQHGFGTANLLSSGQGYMAQAHGARSSRRIIQIRLQKFLRHRPAGLFI